MGLGLKVVMTGATVGAFTVRVTELLACPLGLVTCTVRLWALVPTVTLAVNCELLTNVPWYETVPTFTFNPLPDTKPLPLTVSVWPELEPVMGLGFKLVMAGAT